jgi:hypothetical protein
MYRPCVVLLVCFGFAGPVDAASPDPKSLVIPAEELSRARELVQQLGSEQFAEREKAELELAKMGRLARPALLEGANTDPSQEVRARCSSLLPKATALDIKAKLDVFLADTEGQYEHDLPGWNQFRATVRNEWTLFGYQVWSDRSLDKPARTVFADLIATHANRAVVIAAGGSDADLGQIVAARRQELYNQKFPRAVIIGGMIVQPGVRRDPTAEDIAALLFAETHVPSRFVPRTASISTLITASGFVAAARDTDERGRVYRAIAVAWLDSRLDPLDMYQAMSLASAANNFNMPEHACRIAMRLFTMQGATAVYRGQAAATLARIGGREHIPLLEKAMKDEAILITIRENIPGKPIAERPTHDVQIRDVALAVSILLAGQKIEDYGFVDNLRSTGGVAGAATAYTYSRHYLPEGERKAAFEKWKKWRESEDGRK